MWEAFNDKMKAVGSSAQPADDLSLVFVCVPVSVVCTCVCLIPDVAVEDVSEDVEDTYHRGQRAEEDDSGQRGDSLQHRVNPNTRHLVDPARPAGKERKVFLDPFWSEPVF